LPTAKFVDYYLMQRDQSEDLVTLAGKLTASRMNFADGKIR